ncbi:MAG: sulfatase-like hydrolase/transferase, partial [Saprospiraceae bacterium]|nr:sulfatase-like hydrolase/transferase [Saprospiraceae bacterium]
MNRSPLGFIVLAILWTACRQSTVTHDSPPNILFIVTDDQRWDALGYAGNEIIQTPEMDRLARKGTYFAKTFVTTPICAASRASMLTGLYERTHGYTFQQGPLKEPYTQMSYPVLLGKAGYHTGFYGKFGVQYENAEHLFDLAEIY